MQQIRNYAYSLAGEELSVEIQTNGTFGPKARDCTAENVNNGYLLMGYLIFKIITGLFHKKAFRQCN